MKIDIFRLVSVDPGGIGNRGNSLLDLLYSYFLWKNGLDHYRFIRINQINQNQDIEEFVEIKERRAHVNIIFSVDPSFDDLNDHDKNLVRLEVIHKGLVRLAEKDKRMSLLLLEKIKSELIENNFSFELEGDPIKNPFIDNVTCKILIKPGTNYFDFYILVQENGSTICKINIYRGKPNIEYVDSFFSFIEWRNKNEIVIKGATKEMEMILDVANCKIEFQNLTRHSSPPLWNMMKANTSEAENQSAYEEWLNSLPPAYQAIIRGNNN